MSTAGQQFQDCSAAYRLFEKERLDTEQLWSGVRHHVFAQIPDSQPVVALLDDTLRRKRGKTISGTSWRRDPLGPPFADNFIWARRFLQVSVALPQQTGQAASLARAIPVDLQHAPSPPKPHRKAPKAVWQAWRQASAQCTISALGAHRIQALRRSLDQSPNGAARALHVCVDGTFTCRTVLRDLPAEIELNFRDEKTLLGLGQPQVRTEPAVRTTAAFFVFVYALLLLALQQSRLIHAPSPYHAGGVLPPNDL